MYRLMALLGSLLQHRRWDRNQCLPTWTDLHV